MRNKLIPILIAFAGMPSAFAAHPISAADTAAALELAKTHGCLTCHSTSEKIVGPAYMKVAEKYKDEKDAVSGLVQSIQYGSKGKWGRIPMPPHPSMTQEDMRALARWVLSVEK